MMQMSSSRVRIIIVDMLNIELNVNVFVEFSMIFLGGLSLFFRNLRRKYKKCRFLKLFLILARS